MFAEKIAISTFILLISVVLIITACGPASTPSPEVVEETSVVTEAVEATPTQAATVEVIQVVTLTPEPESPRTLVICQGTEPDTLWLYGGSLLAAAHIQEMIYDGFDNGPYAGLDQVNFGYEPVIMEKIPSLADGDAILGSATASEGDSVVNATGDVAVLDPVADPPILLIPAGRTAEDAFEYTGGDVELDQMVVTFKLLPGLLWSDGTPLTAADSVYSFNVNADPDSGGSKYNVERTASYEAVDDVTIEWTGLPGYKDSEYFVNFWQPLPEHQLGQYTALELMEAEESTRLPLGYGPYIIEDWVRGDSITLSKNPNYFRADEGLPFFDTVVVRMVGDNSNANITALLTGECDLLTQGTGLDDEIERVLELHSSGEINATFTTGTVWAHVDFGIQHSDYDDGYQLGSDRPDFFSDVRTRRAFAMCMDRQAVIDTVASGQADILDVYIPPQHPLFNPEVVHYDFDVLAGSALLEEVGWLDDDGDLTTPRVAQDVSGVPDGTKLELNFESNDTSYSQQVNDIIQGSLALCGIQAKIQLHSEYFADGPEGVLFGRHFDLGTFGWLTGVAPPCDLYLGSQTTGPSGKEFISIMSGEEVPYGGWGSNNNTGFHDPEYEAVCNAAVQGLPGQPGYEEAHREAQRIFAEQLPVVPLYLTPKLAATRPDFCNLIMDPTANSEFWNVEEFDYGEGCED